MKTNITLIFLIVSSILFSQGSYNLASGNKCKVWCKYPGDSVQWDGKCKDGLAHGFGTAIWSEKGVEAERYSGEMLNGKSNGKGTLLFPDGRKLSGNFKDGEFLNLSKKAMKSINKIVLDINDSTDLYISDGSSKELFYYLLIPEEKPIGVLVLLPAAWETVEHAISSTKVLCETALKNNIAVIYPSVNQHIVLNTENLFFMNSVFEHAVTNYDLPSGKFVLGGLSMGGHLSLRYAELSFDKEEQTFIQPIAVFNVDGPTDLENLYLIWEGNLLNLRNMNKDEGNYVISVLEKHTGGSPRDYHDQYLSYSIFSKSELNGGNAHFLKDIPVRIYNDVDVNWWITNRGSDLYSMNALDQSAMINFLNGIGNDKAEFINAFGKGYRIEGNRHPHSWSIVDPEECLSWVLNCLNN